MAKRKYTLINKTSICVNCGNEFTYIYKAGTGKFVCSEKCKTEHRNKLVAYRKSKCNPCSVKGCINKATRKSIGMCENHYYRLRRTGSTDKAPIAGRYVTGSGYVTLLLENHPLSNKSGRVYEHRKVAYDAHNGKCPSCYWCGVSLVWVDAVIDHLNEIKADNSPSNLVVTCNDCNRARGAMLPFILRIKSNILDEFVNLIKDHHYRINKASLE